MDNLTHSLIGASLGELAFTALTPKDEKTAQQTLRGLFVWMGVISSNFPDLDMLYARVTPSPLGYLLHHRGHTHTLLGCVFGLVICLAALCVWPEFRKLLRTDLRALRLTALIGVTGLCLHIAADALNSYGVHPFYPFSTRWIYGDLIFIIEPFWWVVLGVPLLLFSQPRWLWRVLFAIMSGLMIYATVIDYLTPVSLAALFLFTLLLGVVARSRGRSLALQLGVVLAVLYVGVQFVAETNVCQTLRAKYTQPGVHVIDIVLTAMPTNPRCWSALTLQIEEATKTYAVTSETASAFSSISQASSCPQARPAKLEGRMKIEDLAWLAQNDCWFAAWMQFVRVPMVKGETAVDLRFERTGRINFSSLPLIHPQGCPRYLPGWSLPRADLVSR